MAYEHLSAVEVTDIGKQRRQNEDTTLVLPELGVFAVFDGMGGASGGAEASQTARAVLRRKLTGVAATAAGMATLKSKVMLIRAALNEASKEIRVRADTQGVSGSGTTAIVFVFDEHQPQRASILHAGDSRAYRFRAGQLVQLTRDHSFAVAAGVTSERALPPMFRGVVTRAVGLESEVVLEETLIDVARDDVFMLCTDGLTKMLADSAIAQVFKRVASDALPALADVLVGEANTAGGLDNTSVILMGVAAFVPGAVPAGSQAASSDSALPPLTNKPVKPEEPAPVIADVPAEESKPSSPGVLVAGAVAVIAVVAGIYWITHPEWGRSAPEQNIAATSNEVAVAMPAEQPTQQVASVSPPSKPVEPVKTSVVAQVSSVSPPVIAPISVPPPDLVKPPPAVSSPTGFVAVAPPVVISKPVQVAAVSPTTVRPTPVKPPRSPQAVAAAQEMMEMLMGDIVSALSGGHWSLVEETISEWAPTAPFEAKALTGWSVYRGWSAVWREASTGVRPAGELLDPYRAKIAGCLTEMGIASPNLPSPEWSKDARRNADLLCSARYKSQNILLDEMRRRGEDAARVIDLVRSGKLLETADSLRKTASAAKVDFASFITDLEARAKTLVATTRRTRGEPAPMSTDDITRDFAGFVSLRVAEEGFWSALVDTVQGADIRGISHAASQKELSDLRDKIIAGRKQTPDWQAWTSGRSGPADVLKFLMLPAQP